MVSFGKIKKVPAHIGFSRKKTGRKQSAGRLNEFSDVDATEDPQSFITYLDQTTGHPHYQALSHSLISLFGPRKGNHLLDLGCGIGHDTFALAKAVGPKGQVIGIDASRFLLREARKRAKQWPLKVNFRLGDAQHLSLPDRTVDGCWASRVLMHVPDPLQAIREMYRVLKPGGRIFSLEPDWETLVITSGHTKRSTTLRRILQKSILHPGIGHTHPVRFRQAGFQNIAVGAGTFMCSDFALANMAWRISQTVTQAVKFGFLSARHAKHVMHELTSDGAERNFFGSASAFYSTGSKP